MRVNINLATQPYEDSSRFWFRWGGALVALGLVSLILFYVTLSSWLVARRDRGMIAQAQAEIAKRDQEHANGEALLARTENRSTRDRSEFLNDLFQRKAFSWTQVFQDLERVMPPGLHVVGIHPEMGNDNQLEIKLVVAGSSRDRALQLVEKMEGSQRFHMTHIEAENALQGQGTGDTVQFQISALYVPELAGSAARRSTR